MFTCTRGGISTGDFHQALAALLGPNAAGLSSTTVSRLKADWWDEYDRWQRRDLSARRFVYIWADGVYFRPRMAEEKQCVLVLIGADEWGRKEIIGLADGYRESTQSWRELLLDLQRRGLTRAPDLAIGDGALGFWNALREVFWCNERTALLVPQNRQCAQRDAEVRSGQSQRPSPRHLAGENPCRRRGRSTFLPPPTA
jgi:transposase-like protein